MNEIRPVAAPAAAEGGSFTVNGTPRRLRPGTTVAALIQEMGGPSRGVAVAVNREVVPRGRWSDTELRIGDRVEVLTAAQGG